MRWRPLGNNHLWSEAHNLSNIISTENRFGFVRSFVCYPSHPSNDPFRCCISVLDISLPSSNRPNKPSSRPVKQSVESEQACPKFNSPKKRFIHQVSLTTPLVVKNCLPEAVSLTLESGGVSRTSLLSEVSNVSNFPFFK